MEQKLLADIELDVQELKCLIKSFSQESSLTLTELLRRHITQMQGRLGQLLLELESVRENPLPPSPITIVEAEKSPSLNIENFVIEKLSCITEEVIKTTVQEVIIQEVEKEVLPAVEVEEVAETVEEVEAVKVVEAIEKVHVKEEPPVKEELIIVEKDSVVENIPVVENTECVIEKEEKNENPVLKDEVKSTVLGENIIISKGLRSSISLNDSFRFSRELFDGDSSLMNRVVEQISVMSSYKSALAFLSSKIDINEENEALNDFLELLKKYFNQSA